MTFVLYFGCPPTERPETERLLSAANVGVVWADNVSYHDLLAHNRLDGAGAAFSHTGTIRQARARFERDSIASVLARHRGRISDAAKALGIQRTNLYRKMRSLRLARNRRS